MTDLEAITDAALTAERDGTRDEIALLTAELEVAQDENLQLVAELEERDEEDAEELAQAEADVEAIRQEAERVAALPGQVNFFRDGSAGNGFDKAYLENPPPEQQAWMRDHYDRMRVYSPFFDTRTSWFPNGLVYQDAYAIYAGVLPPGDWVLKDTAGQPLYIPYGAKPFKQYAADITSPTFREAWIDQARRKLEHGYKGLFVDDVNYYKRVVRADGTVPASSPCFAGTLTDGVWRQAMALFMWQIRAELPGVEIVHNVVWSVNRAAAEIAEVGYPAADFVEIERGVNDTGITGGTGQFSLRTLLDWVDSRHAQGVSVIWDSQAKSDAEREYGLACYLLTNNGTDMLGSREGGTPADWWAGYDTQLGKPRGPRQMLANGFFSRQFAHGIVYVNEPGQISVDLGFDGRVLGPASGAVILDASIEQQAA